MLVGLVTKNGILIVEFANQRRDAGAATALIAVQEAARARLRPILMTTLATILGIAPIALALGAGAESRVSMGIAVIGGLLGGGALTLYVIPAMYVLLNRREPAQDCADVAAVPPTALAVPRGVGG
jgi:multidrug efflux pump